VKEELFIEKHSMIHALDFWTKFLCLLLLIPLAAFLSKPVLLLLLVAISAALVSLSKVPLKTFLDVSKSYIVPVSLAAMVLALSFSEDGVWDRLMQGVHLSLKFSILVGLGVLFPMVTSPLEMPQGFLRARLPHKYGVTLMVAFRMLPLIVQKASNVFDAQRARGAKVEWSLRAVPRFLPHMMALIIPMIYSTLEVAVNLSDTLVSRGYDPSGKITVPPTKIKSGDISLLLVSVASVSLALLQ